MKLRDSVGPWAVTQERNIRKFLFMCFRSFKFDRFGASVIPKAGMKTG